MAKIILVDTDEEGNEVFEDVTQEVNELLEEREEMQSYLEEVAAGFEEETGIELSHAAEELILSRLTKGASAGAASKGAATGATKAKASAGASTAGISGVGTKGKVAGKAVKSMKARPASLGKHITHAAKVVGRFAAKNKVALAAAGGAAAGSAVAGFAKRKMQLSQEALSLENEEELEDEEILDDNDFTQEELDAMTPEEAVQLLEDVELTDEEAEELDALINEEQRQTELRDFAKSVMTNDAESRNPKK